MPHLHGYSLEWSRVPLCELGESKAVLSAFDSSKVQPIPYEHELRAAIEKLNAKKAERMVTE